MFTIEAAHEGGPAGTLGKINRALKRRNIESKFVTMFFGVLSADGTFVYCNGGHNAPVLLRAGAGRASRPAARSSACSRTQPTTRRR